MVCDYSYLIWGCVEPGGICCVFLVFLDGFAVLWRYICGMFDASDAVVLVSVA